VPRHEHARYLEQRYFPALDGLRALSILAVVWHHSTLAPPTGMLGHGPLGVDLFFIISGYLIATQLLRESSATEQIDLRAFYQRRMRRIFPLYFFVLALYTMRAVFVLGGSPMRAHFFRSLPAYATFTTNWFVDFQVAHPISFAFSWSLAVEEQFYLVFPWLMWGLLRRASAKVGPRLALVACALVLVDQLAERASPPGEGAVWAVGHALATPILLGVLLAACLHVERAFLRIHRIASVVWLAPSLFVLVFALLWNGAALIWVHGVMALLLGSVVAGGQHGLRAVLEWGPVRRLGQLSYGVYMLHVACVVLVRWVFARTPYHPPEALVFACVVPLSALLAKLTHRWVEQPFLRRA
jgi:peptidoglycan/LPS O-acetylase OafA/YrhL